MERINATTGSYNFIDLFAGAGGLSEGFIQAGFSPVAHVEMNPYAAQTLETRTGYYYLKAQGKLDIYKDYISGKITRDEFLQHIPEEQLQSVFCETMSNETLPRLFENIDRILTQRGIKQVDVIIGGPPCQAYSLVGRAQSKHMETPMSADPRNDLYKLYARFLQKYHPKMFVFENVMGIKSANSGATWLKVQEALRSVGYEIECHEQNSKNFGVLQNRRRMIIVGWLKNTGLSYSLLDELEMRWEDEQKLNGLSSVHSMGFRQFIFYLAHKVDFIAEIFLCTMILFGNVGAQPAASFLLKFASFAKFLKQPESLCCFCTNQIFNFFSCNTAVFQCILKNE